MSDPAGDSKLQTLWQVQSLSSEQSFDFERNGNVARFSRFFGLTRPTRGSFLAQQQVEALEWQSAFAPIGN